mgnify:CR=1 FL=1
MPATEQSSKTPAPSFRKAPNTKLQGAVGWKRLVFGAWCLFGIWNLGLGASTTEFDFFERRIRPVLAQQCYECHSASSKSFKAGLRVDTRDGLRLGGKSGEPAVVPGDLEGSLLLDAVQGTNGVRRMPPEGEPLPADQIELLKKWIAGGAKAPVEAVPQDPSKHWAYQPPTKAALPAVANAEWSRNPIDAFVAAQHAARGVTASPPEIGRAHV